MTRDEEVLQICRDSMKVVERVKQKLSKITLNSHKKEYRNILLNPEHNISISPITKDDYDFIIENKKSIRVIKEYFKDYHNLITDKLIAFGKNEELREEVKPLIPFINRNKKVDGSTWKTIPYKDYFCYATDHVEAYDKRHNIMHDTDDAAFNCFNSIFNPDYFIIYVSV